MNFVTRTKIYNILRGTATGWINTALVIAVGLFLAPFLLNHMDRDEYGLFSIGNEALMWLGLMDIGISGSLQLQASQLSGVSNQKKRLNSLASTAFFVQLTEIVIIIVAGYFTIKYFADFFNVRPSLRDDATILITLLVCRSIITLSVKVFSSLLIAFQQIHIDNMIQIGMIIIRTALVVILVKMGFGVLSLGWASIATAFITALLTVSRVYVFLPDLKLHWRLISKEAMGSIINLGIWFSLKSTAHLGIEASSKLVAAKVTTIASVTTLTLTDRTYSLFYGVLLHLQRVIIPIFGNLIGRGEREQVFTDFKKFLSLSTWIAITFACALFTMNRVFVSGWVGITNYGGGWLSAWLAVHFFIMIWSQNCMSILTADMNMKNQTICRLIQCVLGFCLAIILGKLFGLVGVIAGFALGGLFTSAWFLPIMVCQTFSYQFVHFFKNILLRQLLLALILVPFACFLYRVPTYFPWLIDAGFRFVIVMSCGGLIGWWLILDPSSRGFYNNFFSQIFLKQSVNHYKIFEKQ